MIEHQIPESISWRDEKIESLETENARLKEQVAALSKPVSDEEWIEHRAIPSYANPPGTMYRHEINDLIATRLAAAQKSTEENK